MFIADSDINSWKEDLKGRDIHRKNVQNELQSMKFSKPVTWRDVKQKDLEFHPILQKFADGEKENFSKTRETSSWKQKSDHQQKNVEKYKSEYNIINLEKDQTVNRQSEPERTKTRLMPAAQVEYNIITNKKLDDVHFQNARMNVDNKKKENAKPYHGDTRDFNVISNKYFNEHDNKTEVDFRNTQVELRERYDRTHDYNPILAEYYDKSKEGQYQEKRAKEQQDHGKTVVDRLPPTIKNRETIIFDPTREVPEAIKVLDQKKKDAMKKYELRYKVEQQIRERDTDYQTKTDQAKLNRINDKKFTEHLDKGFDIITMNDYDKSQLAYTAKPVQTKWEKIKLTSNPGVQVQQSTKSYAEKSGLTSEDLKQARSTEGTGPRGRFTQDIDTGKNTNLSGWKETMRSGSDVNASNTADFSKTKDFKTGYQRAQEPAYSLADKYNQFCVPPKRVVDDFNTRTLPQIKVADSSLKFSVTKTGGFNRGSTTPM